jgi:hypothetical protein
LEALKSYGFFALPTQSDDVEPDVPKEEQNRREDAAKEEYKTFMRDKWGAMSQRERWESRRSVNVSASVVA